MNTPDTSGQRKRCPGCDGILVGRVGEINIPHWAHLSGDDCGAVHGMTAWHREWQQEVPEDRREVVTGSRRADAVTLSGWVVEFQHSPMPVAEAKAREADYGQGVWIVDMTDRTRPPAWTSQVSWRVFLDYGDHIRTLGSELRLTRAQVVRFINSEQRDVYLNWGSCKTGRGSCVLCSRTSFLFDPTDGQPKHKTCVEEFATYGFPVSA